MSGLEIGRPSVVTEEVLQKLQSFMDKPAELDARLNQFQDAEDSYFATAKTILDLTNRAYDIFAGSEVAGKRQIVKLTLSNLRLDGKTLRYDVLNPFNKILEYADSKLWLLPVDSNHQPSP